MINTLFLHQQYDTHDKSFAHNGIKELAAKRISKQQQNILDRVSSMKLFNISQFGISSGKTYIQHPNTIHNLEYVTGNVDIVLPKAEKAFNWVVIMYNSDQMIYDLSVDDFSKIKIHGNGSRIMGLDEPLTCDVPFSALRLTFIDDIDGWVIT